MNGVGWGLNKQVSKLIQVKTVRADTAEPFFLFCHLKSLNKETMT